VRIRRPDLSARRAILEQAAAVRGLDLSPADVDSLAKKECSTPAQLLGRLANHANSADPHVLADLAVEHNQAQQRVALRHLLAVTARYFGIAQATLTSKSRRASLVQARSVVVHLARRLTDLSYAEIGRVLGGRDHSTIMHADQRFGERLASDPAMQQAVDELDRLVGD
jgi:chromosomal replication initiator protein